MALAHLLIRGSWANSSQVGVTAFMPHCWVPLHSQFPSLDLEINETSPVAPRGEESAVVYTIFPQDRKSIPTSLVQGWEFVCGEWFRRDCGCWKEGMCKVVCGEQMNGWNVIAGRVSKIYWQFYKLCCMHEDDWIDLDSKLQWLSPS